MANKTVETKNSVKDFLNTVKEVNKRKDCFRIVQLFEKNTGFKAKMWGTAIIGFGSYHYKYESGREGDSCLTGFSPRANAIVLYLSGNFEERDELLRKFGKHKTSKGCIYFKTLTDIDEKVMIEMVKKSIQHIMKKNPSK